MGRSRRFDEIDHDERFAYRSCRRKKKFKSGPASKRAARSNQRKYHCPLCGQWHLTKMK